MANTFNNQTRQPLTAAQVADVQQGLSRWVWHTSAELAEGRLITTSPASNGEGGGRVTCVQDSKGVVSYLMPLAAGHSETAPAANPLLLAAVGTDSYIPAKNLCQVSVSISPARAKTPARRAELENALDQLTAGTWRNLVPTVAGVEQVDGLHYVVVPTSASLEVDIILDGAYERTIDGVTYDVPAWGLKSIKVLAMSSASERGGVIDKGAPRTQARDGIKAFNPNAAAAALGAKLGIKQMHSTPQVEQEAPAGSGEIKLTSAQAAKMSEFIALGMSPTDARDYALKA